MIKKVDWNNTEVLNILSSPTLSLEEMSNKIGCSRFYVSRKRKELGLPKITWGGYGHTSTNQERKARYNAKLKLNGYKPLKVKI